MRAYIRIVGQNFIGVEHPYILYDGYTWDGVAGHSGTPINAPAVVLANDDNERDIQTKIVEAASTLLSIPKKDIVLY